LSLLEFIVIGTPVTSRGEARRRWQQRVRHEAEAAATGHVAAAKGVVLRLAYFYVDVEPIGDLDNIVKPLQDALKGIAYADDKQVVDLVASMRPKEFDESIPMSAALARGFDGGSDFIHVVVDQSSRIEAFQ
jgi:hypothetical protein